MPFRRNRFFTGREDLLHELRASLDKPEAIAALSGLGGVGKTQAAVEYSYRHAGDYTRILWTQADSRLALVTGFSGIAALLNLPAGETAEATVRAVTHWLESHRGWLLIFDNADEPDLLPPFLPLRPGGHILLTSRARSFDLLGIARPIEVLPMEAGESLEFLFNRTGRAPKSSDEREAAAQLARDLGHLPLALEQAGAFILARQARFRDYLDSFRRHRLELLDRSRPVTGDPSKSVATTWAMNFREVEALSRAASDLLRLSAFLSPDAIPFELILQGASRLERNLSAVLSNAEDASLSLSEVLEPLTRYSLVRQDVEGRTFNVHRLVQEVVKGAMNARVRRSWARRSVHALRLAFPRAGFDDWQRCGRLLDHVKTAASLIAEFQFDFDAAAELLNLAGLFCYRRAQYEEARQLIRQALEIRERSLPPDHLDVAASLNNLAEVHRARGFYAEAKALHRRSVAIRRKALGPHHPALATSLHNLAETYRAEGHLHAAERLHRRSLAIRERALEPDHPDIGKSLNSLGETCRDQGKYGEAEPLLERSLAIREKVYGPAHPNVATSLDILAMLHYALGRYARAEPLLERSLLIRETALGSEHPFVAFSLNDLAEVYRAQGRYEEAEALHRRSLAIREQTLGPRHPFVARTISNLATLHFNQGHYERAEALLLQALSIREEALGSRHPEVAASLNFLGKIRFAQGRWDEAEQLYRRSLVIREEVLGPGHPHVATSLGNLSELCHAQGRDEEAEELNRRSRQIRESTLGPGHPYLAFNLETDGEIHVRRGRLAEALACFAQSLEVRQKALGSDHPDVARSLEGLAKVYRAQGRHEEAEACQTRSQAIRNRAFSATGP